MLRRYDWLLAGLVFAVLAAMAVHVARTMPVFHPVDEAEHFDYAVKLAKGKAASVGDALEPEVQALRARTAERMAWTYLNEAPRAMDPQGKSFQAYHPSLPYWLAALLPGVARGDEAGVLMLRMLCVAMVIAARVLTYLALRRVSPALALAGLAYLGFMLPVDALRFSNDAPAMLLGALTFLLFVRHATAAEDRGAGLRLAGIAAALLATCAVKVTGILFLIPAIALGIAGCRRPKGRVLREGLAVLLPAVIFAGVFVAGNVQRDGSLTGTAHLSGPEFPPAVGLSWEKLIPHPSAWSFQNYLLLQTETKIGGHPQSGYWKPTFHAAGILEIGWVLAWGFACFGFAGAHAARLGLGEERTRFVRGQVLAGSLLMLMLTMLTAWMVFGLGRVNWSGRQFSVVEGALALPIAAGWGWALAGEARNWRMARIGMWVLAAAVFFSLTWRYLRF